MRAIFGQLYLSLEWTDLDIFFLQTGQNFTRSLPIPSAGWFGLACLSKSIKDDFLLKIQLSDLDKDIFGCP